MSRVKLLMVLTENETLVGPRDLRGLIDVAVTAEAAGIDGVMMSEHVLLGLDSGASGEMVNVRDYAAPGNQSPSYAWPNSVVMLSAIAQATTTLRLVAGAIIAPLRHPLLLAKELGTLDLLSDGRLVVLPTVSWSKDEYTALGVPFGERGKILDEQLEVLAKAWGPYPIRHEGTYFPFGDVWLEPGAFRPEGPTMWFGGQGMHPPLVRRLNGSTLFKKVECHVEFNQFCETSGVPGAHYDDVTGYSLRRRGCTSCEYRHCRRFCPRCSGHTCSQRCVYPESTCASR